MPTIKELLFCLHTLVESVFCFHILYVFCCLTSMQITIQSCQLLSQTMHFELCEIKLLVLLFLYLKLKLLFDKVDSLWEFYVHHLSFLQTTRRTVPFLFVRGDGVILVSPPLRTAWRPDEGRFDDAPNLSPTASVTSFKIVSCPLDVPIHGRLKLWSQFEPLSSSTRKHLYLLV